MRHEVGQETVTTKSGLDDEPALDIIFNAALTPWPLNIYKLYSSLTGDPICCVSPSERVPHATAGENREAGVNPAR